MKRFSVIVIILGVLLMLYPLSTYLFAHYEQYRMRAALEQNGNGSPEDPALAGPRPSSPSPDSEFETALLEIPAINISVTVLRGTTPAVLNRAPGWYEESALPGLGNTAIAGHRTMYGAWFRHLDQLQPGDQVRLTYEDWTFIYRVESVFVVASNDWSVIAPTEQAALTLTTCHPVGSARQRLVLRATLEETK